MTSKVKNQNKTFLQLNHQAPDSDMNHTLLRNRENKVDEKRKVIKAEPICDGIIN